MKIVYLWGMDYCNIFEGAGADIKSVHVLLPKEEPLFSSAAQKKIIRILKDKAVPVSYDQNAIIEILLAIDADVIISMGWRKILSGELLQRLKDRLVINIHPAILPEYKGYHTEPYVIINNEKEHGITAHFLTPNLDDGDILHQVKFPISEFSTTNSIKKQAYDLMPSFISDLLKMIKTGKISGRAQDSLKTKIVAPKRRPQDSEVDPAKPLVELYHSIRACDNERYPAFFYLAGEKIFITIRRDFNAKRENEFEI